MRPIAVTILCVNTRSKLLIGIVLVAFAVLVIYAAINWLPNFFGGGDNGGTPTFGETTELTFEVARARVDCNNGFDGRCLSVNGEPFLQEIEDFAHQNGCTYTLNVERRVAFPPNEAPEETSIYRYRLIAIEARTCN